MTRQRLATRLPDPQDTTPPGGQPIAQFGAYEAGLLGLAYDHRRLAAVATRWAGEVPVLVATHAGLLEARNLAGKAASALDLLKALAFMQGLEGTHRWQHAGFAERFSRQAISSAWNDRSFAYPAQRIVFVTVQRSCLLDCCDDPVEAAFLAAELMALHEVGHVIEGARRLTLGRNPGQENQNIRHGVLFGTSLMRLVRRHAEECFADAFACVALRASGVTAERLAAAYAAFSSGDRQIVANILNEGFSDSSALREDLGIYQTFAAAALAMRAPVAPNAEAVALTALRAARHGALPADVLVQLAEGGGPPGWISDFDPYGALALADHRRARCHIWTDGGNAMAGVLQGITDPGTRLLRRHGMLAALRRAECRTDQSTWDALVECCAVPLLRKLQVDVCHDGLADQPDCHLAKVAP